ncbi:unnamed protein product [Acanthoscelides obtectus]|uniref:Uncharacterized protein n=1 Tax=Acanthoscelides obtectus TaxID=200917 RepID=A0A9P0MHE0_ACAOB|nr:unnamed protein product [Acanthoscelides obtectus]CAK1682399.1 hypothetical protein AOBTE_LOCUS33602 [Acanthoscelides obtectus]
MIGRIVTLLCLPEGIDLQQVQLSNHIFNIPIEELFPLLPSEEDCEWQICALEHLYGFHVLLVDKLLLVSSGLENIRSGFYHRGEMWYLQMRLGLDW